MSKDQERKSVYDSIQNLIGETEKQIRKPSVLSTIHRVPDSLRKTNPSAYDPRIISIGPIHHKTPRLKSMEPAKVAYINRLLCRTTGNLKDQKSREKSNLIDKCIEDVFEKLEEIRASYGQSISWGETENGTRTNEGLAEMMVLDGCFMLELFYAYQAPKDPSDPIFGNILVFRDVSHDLLLLENQIPFIILQVLYRNTLGKFPEMENFPNSLTSLVLSFFEKQNVFKCHLNFNDKAPQPSIEEPPHILGLFHNCYKARSILRMQTNLQNSDKGSCLTEGFNSLVRNCYRPSSKENQTDSQPVPSPFPRENSKYTATELTRAGINFKPIKGERFILAIKFRKACFLPWLCQWCGETKLEIPAICVDDFTEPFLRNLIAYEQCTPLVRHCITSFADLMDHLLDTQDDVDLLIQSKVIENNLSTREKVAGLFHGLCDQVVLSEDLFENETREVERYCNGCIPKSIASLKRNYFSNPWSYISVIAALILFALTVVQTIYTVRAA